MASRDVAAPITGSADRTRIVHYFINHYYFVGIWNRARYSIATNSLVVFLNLVFSAMLYLLCSEK